MSHYYSDLQTRTIGGRTIKVATAVCSGSSQRVSGDDDGGSDNIESQKIAYMHIIKLGKLLAHLRGVVPTWHTQDT
jgi:hypothetical protein